MMIILVQYIYRTDGFLGLYRGFGCSLLGKVVCWYTTTKVDEVNRWKFRENSLIDLLFFSNHQLLESPKPSAGSDDEQSTLNAFIKKVIIDDLRSKEYSIFSDRL